MQKYNYREEMVKDIVQWIKDHSIVDFNDEEIIDTIYDKVWDDDGITGNGYYGYATEEQCAEFVCHNLDLYFEAAIEFDDLPTRTNKWIKENPAQHMDAVIRCYLLNECIFTAIKECKENENLFSGAM